MKFISEKGSKKLCQNRAFQYSLCHILLLFVFLLVYAVIYFLAPYSRFILPVDVSMGDNPDIINDFKGLTDSHRGHGKNNPFLFRNFNGANTSTADNMASNAKQQDEAIDIDWRKDTCDMCFQHNFNYVIDNPEICKLTSPNQKIDIIFVILTEHKNHKRRSLVRRKWLSSYINNTGSIRHVFLLGEVQDLKQRDLVREENDVYHDIIKEDFVDSYKNLTYKTIMGFKWASTKCNHARFVFKTDDDMYVNVNNLCAVNKQESALQTAVMGSCVMKAKPHRKKTSKWYASYTSYPNSQYPGFCSGTGYVTSMNVVQKVYDISPKIPFFHLEDVYIALCVRKLGFNLLHSPRFLFGGRTKSITVHRVHN